MLDYLHIGASRTGSTWLYNNLVQAHPNLMTPNGKKYTAFWNQATHAEFMRKRGNKNWQKHLKPLSWYKDLYGTHHDGIIQADITDGNSWIPLQRIQEIHDSYPSVRITYAIRNPITTIWSHVVKHDKKVPPTASLDDMKKALTDPAYVYNSHYMENIENWISVFNMEQIYYFFFTEIKTEPVSLIHRLCDFLHIKRIEVDLKHNPVINAGSPVPIREDVLEFLIDYHGERIEKMGEYFKKDLSHWLEGKE